MSAEKRKGDAFERDVVAVFVDGGFPNAERALRLGAHRDDGDVAGVPGFHIDAKNHNRYELARWVDEAVTEAGDRIAVVVVKRKGKSALQSYAVVELRDAVELIRRAKS